MVDERQVLATPLLPLLDARAMDRLRWRCRRGMVENDLFLARFFKRHGPTLTVPQGAALGDLMELAYNDLLDLHLARKTLGEVSPPLDRPDVQEVLQMLKGQ